MKLRTPTHEEIKDHHFNIEHNGFYRDLDTRLTTEVPSADARIVLLVALWPGVQGIASQVMRRVMSDLTGAGNAALAMVARRPPSGIPGVRRNPAGAQKKKCSACGMRTTYRDGFGRCQLCQEDGKAPKD
jgi:hypothetical protein